MSIVTVALSLPGRLVKMKQAFDPAKYYDTSFIERAMKDHPEWFNDLPGER